jgi:hypothetical protein
MLKIADPADATEDESWSPTLMAAVGAYTAPWGYAQLQILQQAMEVTKTLDDAKLADYLREHAFTTVGNRGLFRSNIRI